MEMAHVLFMDIVGYSRLAIDEQRATLAQLQDIVRATAEFRQATDGPGLLSLPTGDGMALVFFGSPEDPAECAVQIVTALGRYPHIQLRLGIHTGPVYRVEDINAHQNVAGGGINIAQRVMDCGDAGHILVSEGVAGALGQRKVWSDRLHDLGEVRVKHDLRVHVFNLFDGDFGNPAPPAKVAAGTESSADRALIRSRRRRKRVAAIASAVTIAAVAGAGAWRWGLGRGIASGDVSRRSIAVLPFQNIAKDQSQQYFTTGMTEEIQAQLSKLGALRVMSRVAVADYQRTHEGAGAIARDLGVGSLVTGSVRLAGDKILVNVQLLDANNRETLWSEAYERQLRDVFAVQSDVARRIAASLQAALTPAETARVARAATSSMEAYDLFLKSQALREVDPTRNREAIALLRQATAIDPSFALAHAQTAVRLSFLSNFGDRRFLAEALTSAQAAVAADPALGRAHYALAVAHLLAGRVSQARLSFLKAAELDPSLSEALNDLAVAYMWSGEFDQSLYWARRGFALAPNLSSEYVAVGGSLLVLADDTVTGHWLREAERRFPKSPRLQLMLAGLETIDGHADAALARLRGRATADPGNMEIQAALAEMLVLTHAAEAPAAIEKIFKDAPEGRPNLMTASFRTIYAYLLQGRGEAARATALLDEAEASARRDEANGSETADVPLELAEIQVLRGDHAAALRFLETAYLHGWRLYREAALDPILSRLKNEPAYRQLLARMEADVSAMRARIDVNANPPLPPAK
jgi:TolB-like protein